MNVSAALGAKSEPLKLDGPKVYHIPSWGDFEDPKRMDVIARIAKMRGHDPRMATLAVSILKRAGVQPRDYQGQAAALLHFVQHDLYYVNEPGERLSDPLRTLKVGYGDCDDLVIVLASLLESIRLPWKLTISGTNKRGKKVRYHQGERFPGGAKKGYNWSHIYLAIGDRPFTPGRWRYAETTVRGAPLGWDVVDGDASALPEMNSYGAIMSNYGMDYTLHSVASEPEAGSSGGGLTLGPITTMPRVTPVTPGFDVPSSGSAVTLGPSLTPTLPSGSSLVPPTITKGLDPGGRRRRWWGRGRRRQQPGQWRPSPAAGALTADMVAVVVVRPDGKVLALHRSPAVAWQPGRWDLPGGKVKGAPARAAATRILAAEAGIKTKPERLRRCSAVYHPAAGTSVFFVLRLDATEAKAARISVAKKEHQGWRWVSPTTIRKELRTAPYVDIAFRACFKPRSLDPYSHKMVPAGTAQAESAVTTPTLTGEKVSIFDTAAAANIANISASPLNLLGACGAMPTTGAAYKGVRCPKGWYKRKVRGKTRCVPRKGYSGYGALIPEESFLNDDYFGIPVWGYLAAGGAYYLYQRNK